MSADPSIAARVARSVARSREEQRDESAPPAPVNEPEQAPLRAAGCGLVLDGEIESRQRKMGTGIDAVSGRLKINLKRGGAITGELLLHFLNVPELAELKRGDNKTVTITIE